LTFDKSKDLGNRSQETGVRKQETGNRKRKIVTGYSLLVEKYRSEDRGNRNQDQWLLDKKMDMRYKIPYICPVG